MEIKQPTESAIGDTSSGQKDAEDTAAEFAPWDDNTSDSDEDSNLQDSNVDRVTGKWIAGHFFTRSFGLADVITHVYSNGALAVELVDENGEPITILSVNIPKFSYLLGNDEFFAKTWSENQEIANEVLASGIFRDTGRTSGNILNAPIWAFR